MVEGFGNHQHPAGLRRGARVERRRLQIGRVADRVQFAPVRERGREPQRLVDTRAPHLVLDLVRTCPYPDLHST